MKSRAVWVVFLLVLVGFIAGFMFLRGHDLIIDERVHYVQIRAFMSGGSELHPLLTTIPGYNAVLAGIGVILGISSVAGLRAISAVFGILSVVVFFLLSKKVSGSSGVVKTLQYCFLPILFPLFFVLYTDVFSLFLVLVGFLFLFSKKYNLAGLFGILSVLVRQMNIVWLVFMAVLVYYENYGLKVNFGFVKEYLKKMWVFVLGVLGFVVFLVLNQGVALGDRGHHVFSLYLGNIFFFLIVFFFLFLPLNIANLGKIIDFVKKNWKSVLIVGIGVFLIYMFGFVNTHDFNVFWNLARFRNVILLFIFSSNLVKVLFFIPVAYSLLSIAITRFYRESYYFLWLFSFLVLLPSWFITWRYYLTAFSLFILFRKRDRDIVEYFLIGFFIILLGIVFYGISKGAFGFV